MWLCRQCLNKLISAICSQATTNSQRRSPNLARTSHDLGFTMLGVPYWDPCSKGDPTVWGSEVGGSPYLPKPPPPPPMSRSPESGLSHRVCARLGPSAWAHSKLPPLGCRRSSSLEAAHRSSRSSSAPGFRHRRDIELCVD